MQTVIIQDRQTIFDIAIKFCGDREAAFSIADMNNISLTEELSAGMVLSIPDVYNRRIVEYFSNNTIIPATELDPEETNETEVFSVIPDMLLFPNYANSEIYMQEFHVIIGDNATWTVR